MSDLRKGFRREFKPSTFLFRQALFSELACRMEKSLSITRLVTSYLDATEYQAILPINQIQGSKTGIWEL